MKQFYSCRSYTLVWGPNVFLRYNDGEKVHVSKKTSKPKFKKTYIGKQVTYLEYYSDPLKLNVGVFL